MENGKKRVKSGKRITDEEFRKRVFDKVGDEYTFLEPYRRAADKILVRHDYCDGVYAVEPAAFLGNFSRCPDCSKSVPKINKRFRELVRRSVGSDYVFLTPYKRRSKVMPVRHSSCLSTFRTSPENFLYGGVRCPRCDPHNHMKYRSP